MTGERKREDDSDFLDDDFIVEDIAGKNEDLDQLFEVPGKPKKAAPGGAPSGEDAVDDALFTDHTKGLDPSFEGTPQFAEDGASTWNGEELELEPKVKSKKTPTTSSKASDEGESQEEEFEVDTDKELEVVGAGDSDSEDGIDQVEQSGPFTVEEPEETPEEELEASTELSPVEALSTPGWEPLPAQDMEALAEGAELGRHDPVDANYGDQEQEGELVEAGAPSDGREVFGSSKDKVDRSAITPMQPVRVLGRSRRGQLLMSVAALLLVFSGGALVVFRPELVGLHLEPPRVEQVKVQRPAVALDVTVPKLPASTDPVAVTPTPKPPVTPVVEPPKPQPPVDPVAVEPPQPPVDPVAVEPPKPQPPVTPVTVVTAPPSTDAETWPVPQRRKGQGPGTQSGLIRVSDDLKIGEPSAAGGPSTNSIKGVMPGSRAFAQLHNGNYFIGGVKNADAKYVTMKLDDGEISLELEEIARLTELGSSDYAELQKMTEGFVRLTNNNRLVGGILSQIADDYVVLEFRKNRVMVPRSAIGGIVQGDEDRSVRLDTTREEDDWLKRLAERELGTGQPMMQPSPQTQKPVLPNPPR